MLEPDAQLVTHTREKIDSFEWEKAVDIAEPESVIVLISLYTKGIYVAINSRRNVVAIQLNAGTCFSLPVEFAVQLIDSTHASIELRK